MVVRKRAVTCGLAKESGEEMSAYFRARVYSMCTLLSCLPGSLRSVQQ